MKGGWLLWFALMGMYALVFCETRKSAPTIYLTFDDYGVNDWYALADSLQDIDYKATYYVSKYFEFNSLKKARIKELYERGHEIGHHTQFHGLWEAYKNKPFDVYLEEQIFPLIDDLKRDGIHVSNFAYPHGVASIESDSLLLQHFKTVRHLAYATKTPLYEHNVSLVPADQAISARLYAVGIDKHYQTPFPDIYRAIDSCVMLNKSLLLLSHYVGLDETHEWMTDQTELIKVLRYAHEKGMRFGTINELEVYNPFVTNTD